MDSPFLLLKECFTCGLEKPLAEFPPQEHKKRSNHCTACTRSPAYQESARKRHKAKIAPTVAVHAEDATHIIDAQQTDKASEDAFARLRDARDACLDD